MNNETYDVLVIITTNDNVNNIDSSIQSILNQTFDQSRIKIVAIDNHSTDGTYEKLLEYAINYDIAVNRLSKKLLKTRVLIKSLQFLEFYSNYRYFTILNPGDILYPDYLEKCTAIMDSTNFYKTMVLFSNTDILNSSGTVYKQVPVLEENCILFKKLHLDQFLIKGTTHKVQCLYSYGSLPQSLVEMPYYIDYNDWFKKAFFPFRMNTIYLKDSLSCISETKYDDKLNDIVLRLSLATKFKIYRNSYPGSDNNYLDDVLSNKDIYRNLASLSLNYALNMVEIDDNTTASKMLLLAEVIFEDIVNDKFYETLNGIISSKVSLDDAYKFKYIGASSPPPDSSITFSSVDELKEIKRAILNIYSKHGIFSH